MTNERRSTKRFHGPFDGGWNGESGTRECRIVDLTVGGCFVDSLSNNVAGSKLEVFLKLAQLTLRLRAEVIYVDKVQGFAVRFQDNEPEVIAELADALAILDAQPVR
ncbi:MAG: PilZ domain-containing protein [Acidimicrobiia bacterium]|nr:PilZ domain-containing protein [Acidimicrobiia bacterium]